MQDQSTPRTSEPAAIPSHVPRELVVDFDFRTGLSDRPHETVAALHNGPRIIYSPVNHHLKAGHGTWIPTWAEDIRKVLQDAETFSSKVVRSNSDLTLIPLELDPPMHGGFRTLMNPLFSPARMKALEEKIRERARNLAENCRDNGGCEFIADFARPLPVGIFIDLMGLPADNLERFMAWEELIIRDMHSRARAMQEVASYLKELIAARRKNPTGDLISFAVQGQVDGRPLDDSEILGICVLLFMAGLDTVTSSLSFQFRHLAEHPDEQERLRQDFSIIPAAVEEMFRAYAVVNTTRYATRDVELAGVTIKKGDNVTCSTILACRDPREFENPNLVDFDRSGNAHNAFSYGPHRCIGSHLARRELVVGMEEWLKVIPTFRVAPDAQLVASGGGVFALETLPLLW
ncbi:MAG: cytochrome P450 [Pseudomonas sp.]|uniref:cytochrome P450 n=1 Tax=Pseudomonas sp. TaxID=306 RepID=UPI0039826A08